MELWTMQTFEAYKEMLTTGSLRAPQDKSLMFPWEGMEDVDDFHNSAASAYEWLRDEMCEKIGQPPKGVEYPVWSWYKYMASEGRPNSYVEDRTATRDNMMVLLKLEVPEDQILFSDGDTWYGPLNGSVYADLPDDDPDAFEKLNDYCDKHPEAKKRAWEKTVLLSADEAKKSSEVQATCWEIKPEWIKHVEFLHTPDYHMHHLAACPAMQDRLNQDKKQRKYEHHLEIYDLAQTPIHLSDANMNRLYDDMNMFYNRPELLQPLIKLITIEDALLQESQKLDKIDDAILDSHFPGEDWDSVNYDKIGDRKENVDIAKENMSELARTLEEYGEKGHTELYNGFDALNAKMWHDSTSKWPHRIEWKSGVESQGFKRLGPAVEKWIDRAIMLQDPCGNKVLNDVMTTRYGSDFKNVLQKAASQLAPDRSIAVDDLQVSDTELDNTL